MRTSGPLQRELTVISHLRIKPKPLLLKNSQLAAPFETEAMVGTRLSGQNQLGNVDCNFRSGSAQHSLSQVLQTRLDSGLDDLVC